MYKKYMKRRNTYINSDTAKILICFGMFQFALILLFMRALREFTIVGLIASELLMLGELNCAIKKIKHYNRMILLGNEVKAKYNESGSLMKVKSGNRGFPYYKLTVSCEYNQKNYYAEIELTREYESRKMLALLKEKMVPLLIYNNDYYVMLEEFALANSFIEESSMPSLPFNILFIVLRYVVLGFGLIVFGG